MTANVDSWYCQSCKHMHRVDWRAAVLTLPYCPPGPVSNTMLPEVVPMSQEVKQTARKRAGLLSLADLRAKLDSLGEVA